MSSPGRGMFSSSAADRPSPSPWKGRSAEGASCIHAEGYAACKMNHRPIALIGEGMPVIIVAPTGEFCDKTDSDLEAAAARGADNPDRSQGGHRAARPQGDRCDHGAGRRSLRGADQPINYAVPGNSSLIRPLWPKAHTGQPAP